jgi:hypothetical protein
MIFLRFNLVTLVPVARLCHTSGSGMITFSTSEMSYDMTYIVVPMHVVGQHYFVAPVALARPKGSNLQIF